MVRQPLDGRVVEQHRRLEAGPESLVQLIDQGDADDGVDADLGEGRAGVEIPGRQLQNALDQGGEVTADPRAVDAGVKRLGFGMQAQARQRLVVRPKIAHRVQAAGEDPLHGRESILGSNAAQTGGGEVPAHGRIETVRPESPVDHPHREGRLPASDLSIGIGRTAGGGIDCTSRLMEEALRRAHEQQEIERQIPGQFQQDRAAPGLGIENLADLVFLHVPGQCVLHDHRRMDDAVDPSELTAGEIQGALHLGQVVHPRLHVQGLAAVLPEMRELPLDLAVGRAPARQHQSGAMVARQSGTEDATDVAGSTDDQIDAMPTKGARLGFGQLHQTQPLPPALAGAPGHDLTGPLRRFGQDRRRVHGQPRGVIEIQRIEVQTGDIQLPQFPCERARRPDESGPLGTDGLAGFDLEGAGGHQADRRRRLEPAQGVRGLDGPEEGDHARLL